MGNENRDDEGAGSRCWIRVAGRSETEIRFQRGYLMLDAGCSILAAGRWSLVGGLWLLEL